MRKLTTLFAVVLLSVTTAFSQAPANSNAIMLQGFYWDSNSATSWSQLCAISGELSGNFDIVWLPPSAWAGDYSPNTGYMPRQWCNQNSTWGTANTLKQLIATLSSNGCKAMADIVVNHRSDNGIPPYLSFYPEDFGIYGTWQLGLSDIVSNDDVPGGTGGLDDGEGFGGARDLDHKSANVKNTVKAYLKWMKNVMGYDGWRYDMVKGFRADVIGEYNDAANAYMSVGEHWSGAGEIKTWIEYTGRKSAAFDFPLKYDGLRDGLAAGNYGNMARGIAFDQNYRKYSVTFVDNHDTYRDGSKYLGNVLQAYAFLMSSPGIPCVFYPHWIDNKVAINDMIKARKSIGMTNETNVNVENTSGYYKVFIQGTAGMMLTYIGNNGSDAPADPGWNLVASGGSGGTSYKMYTNISNPALLNAHLQKISNGTNCPARPTITSITIDAIVPASWTAPKIHVWAVGGSQISVGNWPGQLMTPVSGVPNKYTITFPSFTAASEVGIVINNGAAANTQQTINLYAEGNVCYELEATPTMNGQYKATVSATCGFVNVADIQNVPGGATVNIPLTLTGTVLPVGATNQTITWSLVSAGTTGATVSGSTFTATATGIANVKATVANGTVTGDYSKTFDITVNSEFVPVTSIQNLPTATVAVTPLALTGNVQPTNATNQTITWSVVSQGSTGAVINGSTFTATAAGTARVKATIANGLAAGSDYTTEFDIMVTGGSGFDTPEAHNLKIYPNPVSNTLYVDTEKTISKVTVLSISGQRIISSNENTIDVSVLGAGIYLLKVEFENSQVVFEKFVKK